MKLGVCASTDNIHEAQGMGFDYVELHLAFLATIDEDSFKKTEDLLKNAKIKAEAANGMFPSEIKLVGPERNLDEIRNYLKTAFDRAAKLGIEVCVFGSGMSRKAPEGYSEEKIHQELLECSHIIADTAKDYGIVVALEHLNSKETNTINKFSQALELAKEVNKPNFKLVCDLYHLVQENDSEEDIISAAPYITHVHIANPVTRDCPNKNDSQDYKHFFNLFEKINYNRRISFEGRCKNRETELPDMLQYFREII